MGGCRCSFSNCTVRSDGATHLFHYPVFEKARCHKWLTNAGRLDLMNLTVAQLKNRVICQYHFEDNMFMNFKKDKLRFDAVPTLAGPYCDDVKHEKTEKKEQFSKAYLVLDDREYLDDKQGSYKKKYVDFLTNGEYLDIEYIAEEAKIKPDDILEADSSITKDSKESNVDRDVIYSTQCYTKKGVIHPYLLNTTDGEPLKSSDLLQNKVITQTEINKLLNSDKVVTKSKSKVKILSEDKLSYRIPLTGEFRPVSPSLVLQMSLPNKTLPKSGNQQIDDSYIKIDNLTKASGESFVISPLCMEKQNSKECVTMLIEPSEKSELQENQPIENAKWPSVTKLSKERESYSKMKLRRPYLSAERIAAIEEKRSFNMKLKDIIQSSLLFEEDEEKHKKTDVNSDGKVGVCFKDTHNDNFQDSSVSCIESSMRRMERVLLNKIEQNSQRIAELAGTMTMNAKNKAKSSGTQTVHDVSYKHHLYQEISKFLSPELKSMVYEELFIDNYSIHDVKPKRKKFS